MDFPVYAALFGEHRWVSNHTTEREPKLDAIIRCSAALQAASMISDLLSPRALPWAEGGRPVGPQESNGDLASVEEALSERASDAAESRPATRWFLRGR